MILRINLEQNYSSQFGNSKRKQCTSNTATFYENSYDEKRRLRQSAMRTSVPRTTASSQTTTGTTRTACSSPSTTPMTTRWHIAPALQRTRGVHALRLHAHLCSTAWWWHRTPLGSSSERIHSHPRSYPWAHLFDSVLPFYFHLLLLSVPVFFFHLELFLELHYTIVMANLRCSAAEEVRTPWSPSPLSQVVSPTSWPSASSTTHHFLSPSWPLPRTRTWMTWHSARCSQRHTEDKSTTAYQEACQSVSRRRL